MNLDVVKNLEVLFFQKNSTNIIKNKVIDFEMILHYFHLFNQEIDGKKKKIYDDIKIKYKY